MLQGGFAPSVRALEMLKLGSVRKPENLAHQMTIMYLTYTCTTLSVLMDSMAANVTRDVAASDSALMGEPAPDSKPSIKAFISAACPLSPENEVLDFFRPTAHSSLLKFHMRAVLAPPNTSRYSFSTALEPLA